MIRTPSKDLNEGAGGFVKGTAEFMSQMSKFKLTPLDTEWINLTLNNTRREDIPNAYKKILKELSIRESEIEKDRKQQKVVNDALVVKKRYMGKYKQWKNGELPGKALISELKSVIEHMENAVKIFGGEQIDKSRFQYSSMLETSQEFVSNTINYLRAFYDELETANGDKQAPETDDKMTACLKDGKYIAEKQSKNGKYDLIDNAERTVHRFMYNNYQKYEDWNFLWKYLEKYTNHYCTIETLKRYIREYKKIVPVQLRNQETFESLQESI